MGTYARKNDTATLQRSWLVQRLEKPPSSTAGPFAEMLAAFSFGGGLANGGLSKEAMNILKEIFRFDYMGAAEFEWGAVPEALGNIRDYAVAGRLEATFFDVPLKEVLPDFREKTQPADDAVGTVYVLAPREWRAEVEERIRGWACDGYQAALKEQTKLNETLRPSQKWHGEVVGWLELDNGFFFFTDREMWQRTADLFGVSVPA